PRAELLRCALRPVAPVRSVVYAAGAAGEAADLGVAPELHRAVRAPHAGRREGLRAALEVSRFVRPLVDDLRDHWHPRATRLAAGVSAPAAARPRLSGGGADVVGRRF